MQQKEIAKRFLRLLGEPEHRLANVSVNLNRYVKGVYPLPKDWEIPLLQIMGIQDKTALRKKFPAMRFSSDGTSEIELVVISTTGKVSTEQISEVLAAVQVLWRVGIQTEIRIRNMDD